MSDFRKHLADSMEDPKFAAEWDAQATERGIMRKVAQARIDAGISQKELAERCNMRQSNLSRLENGNANPSVETLRRIAHGLGKRLEISFV